MRTKASRQMCKSRNPSSVYVCRRTRRKPFNKSLSNTLVRKRHARVHTRSPRQHSLYIYCIHSKNTSSTKERSLVFSPHCYILSAWECFLAYVRHPVRTCQVNDVWLGLITLIMMIIFTLLLETSLPTLKPIHLTATRHLFTDCTNIS